MSVRAQSYPCSLVVVDNHSADETAEIARRLADLVLVAGPERSTQRNLGAAGRPAGIFGFIDSDMLLEPEVVAQAVAQVQGGCGSVIIPEYTVGLGYWARVREFERSFYTEGGGAEAARFFDARVFNSISGYDEGLTSSEDWDVTLRAGVAARVGRTVARVAHDEGRVRYFAACARKGRYAAGMRGFTRKHGASALSAALDRPYLRQPWRLVSPHPALGLGVIALKAGEAIAVGGGLARSLVWPR